MLVHMYFSWIEWVYGRKRIVNIHKESKNAPTINININRSDKRSEEQKKLCNWLELVRDCFPNRDNFLQLRFSLFVIPHSISAAHLHIVWIKYMRTSFRNSWYRIFRGGFAYFGCLVMICFIVDSHYVTFNKQIH